MDHCRNLSLLGLVGCTSGNCRSYRTESLDEKTIAAQTAQVSAGTQTRTKVFKYDGSKQCGTGKAITITDMQKDLGTIVVYSSENKADGLMHMQVCGSNTGRANVYEIDQSNLDEAKKRGFKEWTFE